MQQLKPLSKLDSGSSNFRLRLGLWIYQTDLAVQPAPVAGTLYTAAFPAAFT